MSRSRPARRADEGVRLVVDPVACQGVALCSHLAPGIIAIDPWGYPVVPGDALSGRDVRAAEVAAAACPREAIHLLDARSDGGNG